MHSTAFLSKVEIDLLAFSFIDKWSIVKLHLFKRCPLIFKPKLKPLASEAKGSNVIFFFLKPFTVVCK